MKDLIILLIVLAAVGYAAYYIYKEKKKGRHCIGCPSSGSCSCGCDKKK